MHITSLDKEKNDRNFGKLIATFPFMQFQNNIFKLNLNAESSLIYYEKSRNHIINNNLVLSKEYVWYFDVFNVLFDKMSPNCLDGLILRSSNGVNYIYSRASKYLIQAEFSKLRSDNNYFKYYESFLFAKNQAIYKVFEKNDATVFKISLNKFLTLPSRYIYLKVTSTKKLRQATARFGDFWNSTLVKKSINNKNILDVYTYEILLESLRSLRF
jgi:hypothetical protein